MQRIRALDGLRAIAVLMVIAHHLAYPHTKNFLWLGTAGVYVFFAISGYIITRTLMEETKRDGSFSLRNFYIRRACRILPPLWIFLFAMSLLGHNREAVFSLAFLCNTSIPGSCGDYIGHTWSLGFEEQFYLLYPMLLAFFMFGRKPGLLLAPALAFALLPLALPGWIGRGGFFEVYALLLGGALIALRGGIRFPRWITKPLSIQPLPYIGQISYTIYLWQQIVPRLDVAWQPLALFAVFLWAAVSFHTVERWFIVRGKALTGRFRPWAA